MRNNSTNTYSSVQRSGSSLDSETGYTSAGGFAASPATERGSFLPGEGGAEASPRSSFAGVSRLFFLSRPSRLVLQLVIYLSAPSETKRDDRASQGEIWEGIRAWELGEG